MFLLAFVSGCIGSGPGANGNGGAGDSSSSARKRKFPLHNLPTATITVNGQSIRVWVAATEEHRAEGFMYVAADEIADDQGMLFIFEREKALSFWMKNTITPLDIAFARDDGLIVKTHTMPPLTLQSFPSEQPARFALEMKAGFFERLNIRTGDLLVIPADLLKP